jgi:pyochelin biosynthetic protein PchC
VTGTRADRYASGRWLRCAFPRPQADTVLLAFPHAGGSATFYRSWGRDLPAGIELIAVQYPGRLDRLREPCVEDLHQLAESVLAALDGRLDRPVALFGHSMGAVVAYEAALRLEARGLRCPAVFLSSHPAPGRDLRRHPETFGDEGLLDELRRLGATPAGLIDTPAMRDAVLTSLRGDYRAVARYRPRPGRRLRCPVVTLVGDADPDVDPDDMRPWAGATTGPAARHVLPGDHFYLVPQRDAVLGIVAAQLGRAG